MKPEKFRIILRFPIPAVRRVGEAERNPPLGCRNSQKTVGSAVASSTLPADGTLNLSRTFNSYGETESQAVTAGGQGISQMNLTRSNAGRITAKNETSGGVTSDYSYTYDAAGRLLTVTKNGVLTEEYRYSANGSRVYEMNTLRGIAGRNLSYSAEDHLLTGGDVTYTHSPDGFLTAKTAGTEVTACDYSSRGELMGVTLPGGTSAEYVHDPLGRRIAKKVNGVITEKYLWSGLTTLLAVYDGSDNLLMRFEYADSRMPFAMMKAGVLYYMAYDQVGSLKLVADSAGNVVKRVEYDTFGNIISDSNPGFAMPFGFAGGLYDRDTKLVRFGYRDYDPETGRWTAKDPIGFAGGDTDLYGYCLGDPVNLTDADGLAPKDKHYGLPKRFWNWAHRKLKERGITIGDFSKEDAEEMHKQWESEGRPLPDNKGKHKRGKRGLFGGGACTVDSYAKEWPDSFIQLMEDLGENAPHQSESQ